MCVELADKHAVDGSGEVARVASSHDAVTALEGAADNVRGGADADGSGGNSESAVLRAFVEHVRKEGYGFVQGYICNGSRISESRLADWVSGAAPEQVVCDAVRAFLERFEAGLYTTTSPRHNSPSMRTRDANFQSAKLADTNSAPPSKKAHALKSTGDNEPAVAAMTERDSGAGTEIPDCSSCSRVQGAKDGALRSACHAPNADATLPFASASATLRAVVAEPDPKPAAKANTNTKASERVSVEPCLMPRQDGGRPGKKGNISSPQPPPCPSTGIPISASRPGGSLSSHGHSANLPQLPTLSRPRAASGVDAARGDVRMVEVGAVAKVEGARLVEATREALPPISSRAQRPAKLAAFNRISLMAGDRE